MKSVFTSNKDVLKVKGWIPYWEIADKLSIHENTLRNWMKREMDLKRKELVLNAIKEIRQQQVQEAN